MDSAKEGAFVVMNSKANVHREFRSQVLRPLRRFAWRAKSHAALRGFSALISLLVTAILVHFALDKLLVLGFGPRLVLLIFLIGVTGKLLFDWALRPLSLDTHPLGVAAFLEAKFPTLRDRLLSAVAFAQSESRRVVADPNRASSAIMVDVVIRDAQKAFADIPFRDLLLIKRSQRIALLALALLAAIFAASLYAPAMARTYVQRDLFLRDVPWPSDVQLTVEGLNDGRLKWPIGDDFTLAVKAERRVPAGLAAEIVRQDGASVIREMSIRGTRQFVLDYGPLDGSLKLRFLIHKFGVDDATDWYHVDALERPSIKELAIKVTPPSYTGLASYALGTGQTSAEVLRGSSVQISAATNKAITQAELLCGNETVAPASIVDERRLITEFVPSRGGTYQFKLLDRDQLSDTRPVTCSIQLQTDPPPKVRLTLPGAGEAVIPTAVLPLAVEAEDNLGLSKIEMSVAAQHDPSNTSTSQPAISTLNALPEFTPHQMKYNLKNELPLMPRSLKPGDQVTLFVEARDYQPSSQFVTTSQPDAAGTAPLVAGVGRSPALTLRIISVEELLAELGRRESEWRREFELVIKAQEQIKLRLMNLHDENSAEKLSTEVASRYGQEERAQRQLTNRVKTIRRQFEQILAEMRVNQLDQPTVRRRLENNIIKPLGRLISTDMSLAADQLEQLRMRNEAQLADQLETTQTRIVESMYGILAGMLKWEGYNEAVSLLRDIIRMQGDVGRQTQGQMEKEIEQLLDDPARRPKKGPSATQPE